MKKPRQVTITKRRLTTVVRKNRIWFSGPEMIDVLCRELQPKPKRGKR